jgi:uncharacterized protein (TIGR03083 family)
VSGVPGVVQRPPTARRPGLDRASAARLAAAEYDRFTAQLRRLTPQQWTAPTACPDWDVHAMVCHVLGMAEAFASPVEQVRQLVAARRAGGLLIDALTALQVAKHVHRPPEELVRRMAEVGPKAAAGRARTPALLRRLPLRNQAVDDTGTVTETWRLGYLVDVIVTRDTWMHRSDIAAAAGLAMVLDADHDGRIVADVAAEWAARHGQPCTLTLTGPAGGQWTWGIGGEAVELDAVEFCRVLSGRGTGAGLVRTRVPF